MIPRGSSTAWRTNSKSFFYNPLRVAYTCYFSNLEDAAALVIWAVAAADADAAVEESFVSCDDEDVDDKLTQQPGFINNYSIFKFSCYIIQRLEWKNIYVHI